MNGRSVSSSPPIPPSISFTYIYDDDDDDDDDISMMISTVADDEKHLDAVADDDSEQVVGIAGVHQGGGGQVRLIPHLEHHVEHVKHDHTKDMTFYNDREWVIFENRST